MHPPHSGKFSTLYDVYGIGTQKYLAFEKVGVIAFIHVLFFAASLESTKCRPIGGVFVDSELSEVVSINYILTLIQRHSKWNQSEINCHKFPYLCSLFPVFCRPSLYQIKICHTAVGKKLGSFVGCRCQYIIFIVSILLNYCISETLFRISSIPPYVIHLENQCCSYFWWGEWVSCK